MLVDDECIREEIRLKKAYDPQKLGSLDSSFKRRDRLVYKQVSVQ